MRIATFNVENLFSRVRVMNFDDLSEGKPILTEYSRLNRLLSEPTYIAAKKTAMLESLDRLGLTESDESKYVLLRQNRGRLLKRPKSGPPEVIANGRGDWIGWLELKTEAVNEIATRMTAKVIQDVNADILAVVEAEDRLTLSRFNDQLLKPINAAYREIMLIDGNDERGIDVGILTKSGYQIESIVSHINDQQNDTTIFSRDCPEYTVQVNDATRLLILVNHFKSKGYGEPAASNARRKTQAQRVREIYDQRRQEGIQLIAIVGDLNDTPESEPLKPLLGNGSDLRDISKHPTFVSDGRSGTYANGTATNKIDYLLLSPELFNRVTAGGVFRKGVWGGTNGDLFPHYEEMEKPIHAASDHAALWADINLLPLA
jgi:endonuclease/exonuclease/phosphatase family metal-dependent hydrolase